jgi:hypothetical protein
MKRTTIAWCPRCGGQGWVDMEPAAAADIEHRLEAEAGPGYKVYVETASITCPACGGTGMPPMPFLHRAVGLWALTAAALVLSGIAWGLWLHFFGNVCQ